MTRAPILEQLRASMLNPSGGEPSLSASRALHVFRDDDALVGKLTPGRHGRARSGQLGAQLSKLMSQRSGSGRRARVQGSKSAFTMDPRQRVVATVAYQGHGAGAAGRLLAHGKYLERDGAGLQGEPGRYYDREHDGAEVDQRLTLWARDDKRHFRLLLAPESGARIEDLKDFTRATMARMERDLGFELEWIAVDHHNTDNAHVHVVLRGRRSDGAELVLPRDYVRAGLRYAARDVATEMLGERGPEDERLALERETRAPAYTRLDRLLESEMNPGAAVRIQAVGKSYDPVLRAALRNRVRELTKFELAREIKRGLFLFEPAWSARLQAIGHSLDVRRALGRERTPGAGKLQLYQPRMGALIGEVLDVGARDEGKGKSYAIVRAPSGREVFVNLRTRDVAGMDVGAMVRLEARVHEARGARVRAEVISPCSLAMQVDAQAETELDRELARVSAGRARRLPQTPEVAKALAARVAWHEREGTGARDLTGWFAFAPGALERLRESERSEEGRALGQAAGKHLMSLEDGLEREWRVRAVKMLHQGRFALLERQDAVALLPLAKGQYVAPGGRYAITWGDGKARARAAPGLGLDR